MVVAMEKTSMDPIPNKKVPIMGVNQNSPDSTSQPYMSRLSGNMNPATQALIPMRSSGRNSSGASGSVCRFTAALCMMLSFQRPPRREAMK